MSHITAFSACRGVETHFLVGIQHKFVNTDFFCHNDTIQVLLYVGYAPAFQIGLTGESEKVFLCGASAAGTGKLSLDGYPFPCSNANS